MVLAYCFWFVCPSICLSCIKYELQPWNLASWLELMSELHYWFKKDFRELYQVPRLEWVLENYFSYFSAKTYVVGTQKNHLNKTVLLSTQNACLNWWVRKYMQLSGPMLGELSIILLYIFWGLGKAREERCLYFSYFYIEIYCCGVHWKHNHVWCFQCVPTTVHTYFEEQHEHKW